MKLLNKAIGGKMNLKSYLVFAFLISLTLGVAGCSKSSSNNPVGSDVSAVDFIGTWAGSLSLTGGGETFPDAMTLELSESDGAVSGIATVESQPGIIFSLNGTVTGGILNFTMDTSDTDPACDYWDVSGTGSLNADGTMSFWAQGPVCYGSMIEATFSAALSSVL